MSISLPNNVPGVRAPKAKASPDGAAEPGSFAKVLETHERAAEPEPETKGPRDDVAQDELPADDATSRWASTGETSRQNGPEDMSDEARPEGEASAEEPVTAQVIEATPLPAVFVEDEAPMIVDPGSAAALEAEVPPQGEAAAAGEVAFVAAAPNVEPDLVSGSAHVGHEASTKAKADVPNVTQWERVADVDPGEDVEVDTKSSEAEGPKLEVEPADVEVEVPAPAVKAEPVMSPVEGARPATVYDAVGRGVRAGAAEAPPPPTWDVEVIERLRAQESLQKLQDGRLRLQVNDGGERVTLTLQEMDGALHLSARTASRGMAEAMVQRVHELREALADLGLVLGDLDAQADPQASAEDDPESEAEGEGREAPLAQMPAARPVMVRRHRIIA